MDLIGSLLWPLKWIVEAILAGFHLLFSVVGVGADTGANWILSIVGLVVVVRALLLPLTVKQLKNQRRMMALAPRLKEIQEKYRGKQDQLSREAVSRETMALYRDAGANPLSSCVPLLVQMPIFFSLFSVLHTAQLGTSGVGFLTTHVTDSLSRATLFGAPLHDTFLSASNGSVRVVAALMIVVMIASQILTQKFATTKNMTPEAKAGPAFRQQQMLMYLLPFVFVISGLSFPLGVMAYWFTSNLWTTAQQIVVVRVLPTPGSEAALAFERRLSRRGRRQRSADKRVVVVDVSFATPESVAPSSTTRPEGEGR